MTKKTKKKAAAKKKSSGKAKSAPKPKRTSAPPSKKTTPPPKLGRPVAGEVVSAVLARVTDGQKIYGSEVRASLERVRGLQRKGMECAWQLGRTLASMYEGKAYTQVTDLNGKPLYNSWRAFVRDEIGIESSYALKLMDVAAVFDEKQIAEVGVTKLQLLVRVPEEMRSKLLEQAADTSRSRLSQEVKRLVGSKVRETGRNGFAGRAGAGPRAQRSERLTVIRTPERVVVDLFHRGSNKRAFDVEDAAGTEHCANGVVVHYQLMRTEQGLALAIETRRETGSKAA